MTTDDYNAMWRASAHEAVPYTDDFPECFLVLPELIDGAIAQGEATIVKIIINLNKDKGSLTVSDNGRGISNPNRLLNWASKDSTTLHHRYGHGSKKCLTKWNKNYDTPWYIKYRTIDRRGNMGSLFTYNGPFEGNKLNKLEEDEKNDTLLIPSGLEWYIEFDKITLNKIDRPILIFDAIKEIIRTRYSKKYLDKTEFIIQISEGDNKIYESSKEKQWKTFQECIEDEVAIGNCSIIKHVIEDFNNIVIQFTKYQIKDDIKLKKEFPKYGYRKMDCSRVNISLNGRTIEQLPYHKCLNKANHNSFNGIIGFVNFEGEDFTKMPTPCTTKVSFYENCQNFKDFLEKFSNMNIESKPEPIPNPIPAPTPPKKKTIEPEPKPPKQTKKKTIEPDPNPNQDDEVATKQESEPILKKKSLSKIFKQLTWNRYIGENIASHKCLCCKITTIKNTDFVCGHVKPESKGGETEIENMRPICSGCNSSMGTKDMITFVKENGFYIG